MTAAADPLIGTDLGNYKITSKIGVGGMGAVYLGVQPQIGKRVAVKVLHSEFAEKEDVVQRFLQEARAVAALHHPNIVELIDFGQITPPGGGTLHYCVMELLEGETLRDRMKAGPVPQALAANLARQIAAAVGCAHQQKIIHRDLKPENVFLVGAEKDVVKILDFGIAKLTGEGQASMQTQAGTLLGTPSYMSPEQCMARPVDARTDVYSLGIILFEMCCGRLPFIGEGYADLLIKQINGDTPAPRSINPDIAPGLEHTILTALQKEPSKRIQSMDEFIEALNGNSPTPAISTPHPPVGGHGDATVLSLGNNSNAANTLQAAAAEMSSGTGSYNRIAPVSPKRSIMPVIGITAGLLVAGAGAGFVLLHDSHPGGAATTPPAITEGDKPPEPVKAEPPPPAKKVHLHIASEPDGAQVKKDEDGTELGTTPIDTELSAGTMLKLTIHKDGFKDESRAIVINDRDKTIAIQLRPDEEKKKEEKSSHHHGDSSDDKAEPSKDDKADTEKEHHHHSSDKNDSEKADKADKKSDGEKEHKSSSSDEAKDGKEKKKDKKKKQGGGTGDDILAPAL